MTGKHDINNTNLADNGWAILWVTYHKQINDDKFHYNMYGSLGRELPNSCFSYLEHEMTIQCLTHKSASL